MLVGVVIRLDLIEMEERGHPPEMVGAFVFLFLQHAKTEE